jgi:hypothetical protein
MAVVQGIREKVHLPIYDSFHVKPKEQLRDVANGSSSILKFFVDVQRKTKLETNLQSASLLPHYNTFEARAMRVVISDLPLEASDEVAIEVEGEVLDEDEVLERGTTHAAIQKPPLTLSSEHPPPPPTPLLRTNLRRAMALLKEARENDPPETVVSVDANGAESTTPTHDITLTVADLEDGIFSHEPETEQPPEEQIRPDGTLIGKLIYNTVTTLYVGEKIMIQMPTWFFPAGAGPYSEAAAFTTHGEPSPTATFRFAEPVFIDKQQNFRVEIEIPDTDVLKQIQRIYGPLFIWVVLDGYMVRDVQ